MELKFEEPWLGTKSLSEELALAQLSVQMLERNFEELSWENSSARVVRRKAHLIKIG